MWLPLPSAWETVTQLVVYSLVEDYMSFWLHRFLHNKWGYDKIHHVNHEIRTPTGFAASYADGMELTMYAITIFAGPAIVPCHAMSPRIGFGSPYAKRRPWTHTAGNYQIKLSCYP
jgi:sterol desaturase/sphingolipid hydroxylase (fatty acid hydroxylase superfamily)